MSDPIVEQIAENIVADIAAITEANGFNQDLLPKRPLRLDFEDFKTQTDRTVLVVQDNPVFAVEDDGRLHGNPMKLDWAQPFVFICFVRNSDDDNEPIDTRMNRIKADIEKKLQEDTTRGGLAYDTKIMPSERMDKNDGILVGALVFYRVAENDPYTGA